MTEQDQRPMKRPWWRCLAWLGLGLGVVFLAGTIGLWVRRSEWIARESTAARAALDAGRPAAARQRLEGLLRSSPGSAEAHALMAEAALLEGDLGQVTAELNR